MLEILISWFSPLRAILILLDSVAYGLIDNVYNLIKILSEAAIFDEKAIRIIMNNTYIIISIFALFRIALILVNAIINPDKLTDKETGIGSVLRNLIIMFVLLIFTPMLFHELYHVQSVIVEGNYVSKVFTGSNITSGDDPGKTMQRIAIKALIHPDEQVATLKDGKYVANDNCEGKCYTAVDEYNKNVLNGDEKLWPTLIKNIGRTIKNDGETVYVYTYMYLVTFAVGIFITYVLLGMAIDIAVRSVELAFLQIVAPLFIVTYIDPKSAKSGPFHKWLTTVGKTYASLFIKLAVLELMIMLISLSQNVQIKGLGIMGTLVILIAILIFAKKAPKWIGDMIGVDDEGTGIGGLGKKLGSAALIGGALTAAGHAAAGAAVGAASMIHKNNQNRRAQKKAAREELGYKRGPGRKAREARDAVYEANKDKYADMSKKKALKQMKRDAYRDNNVGVGDSLKQFGAAAFVGTLAGGKVGLASNDLKGAFKGGKDAAKEKADRLAFTKNTTKAGEWIRDIPSNVEGVFGDPNELYDKRKALEDAKNAKFHSGGKYQAGLGKGKIVEGNGDAKKLFDNYKAASEGEAVLAQYLEATGAKSYDLAKTKETLKKRDSDGKFIADIIDENGNPTKSNVNLNDELYVSGTGGIENLKKMFNTYQSNALANSIHSQEQYMQQAGTYQSILSTQNATVQNAQVLASALASSLSSAGISVEIDASSMSGIKNAITKIGTELGNVANENQKKLLTQKYDDLKKYEKDYDDSQKQLSTIRESMNDLKSAFDELQPIVAGIKGTTTTEKEQTLAIELSKLEKTLEGIKKPSEDKK